MVVLKQGFGSKTDLRGSLADWLTSLSAEKSAIEELLSACNAKA
jgi:hypothetical protein